MSPSYHAHGHLAESKIILCGTCIRVLTKFVNFLSKIITRDREYFFPMDCISKQSLRLKILVLFVVPLVILYLQPSGGTIKLVLY